MKPDMYRHFAVLTVSLTLVMVIFSDGESRQATAAEVEARQNAEAAKIAASKPKYGAPKFKQRQEAQRWREFNESGGTFGEPTDFIGSRVQRVGDLDLPEPSRLGGEFTPQDYDRFGISQAELAALTPEEREKLLARLRAGGLPTDPEARARQIEKLVAASAQRSGGTGGFE